MVSCLSEDSFGIKEQASISGHDIHSPAASNCCCSSWGVDQQHCSCGGGAFLSKMGKWSVLFETVPSYRGGTLADVLFSGEKSPGALKSFKSWPQELQATTSARNPAWPLSDDWSAETTRIIFKGAGESRLVYVSENGQKVFKISDATGRYNKDDNKNEFNTKLPLWLVPEVCGFVEEAYFAGVRVSVLIVRACSDTLATLGKLGSAGGDMHCQLLRSWVLRFRKTLVQDLHPKTALCLFVQLFVQ